MDILAISDIHQNFGILPEELSALRQCICDAGIRWGWDETEHEAHGGQSFCETSWRYGLDRLLLDYAGLEKDEKNNLFRADSAGLDGVLLGNFCRFADVLHDTVLWMRERETSLLRRADKDIKITVTIPVTEFYLRAALIAKRSVVCRRSIM